MTAEKFTSARANGEKIPILEKCRKKQPKESPGWRDVDGGYGWIVTIVSCIINMFNGGFPGGIILPEIMSYFPEVGNETATLLFSLKFACFNVACLFAGCMSEVYGCRAVAVIGGVFVALGSICSAFVRTFHVLYLTFSFFIGIGLALRYISCIVLTQQYFTKHRRLATGIVMAGVPIGVFVFSMLIQWFIDAFAWQGALLLMGGINLHGIPLGVLLSRPNNLSDNSVETNNNAETKSESSTAVSNIKKTLQSLLTSIKELSEAKIALSIIAFFLKAVEHNVPYFFLPMKITHLNYSRWHAAMTVTVMGAGDLCGRLLVCATGAVKGSNLVLIFSIIMLLNGVSEVSLGMLSNFYALCACAFLTTMLSGLYMSIKPPMLVDLVGMNRVARILGLLNIGEGLGNFAGLPFLAFLYSFLGNFNMPFFACSIGPMISSILMLIVFLTSQSNKDVNQ